ncbi:Hypoxia-inducible factor 1-alpha inhibitor, partial [Auxenochlorella protothecoides]
RLLVCDAEKNIYGSHYHIREPESSTIKLTAAEFVQCARKWKSKLLVLEGLYPYPVHHGYDKYSMVNLEEPDVAEWPLATRLKAVKAVLHPGDALFIPNYW